MGNSAKFIISTVFFLDCFPTYSWIAPTVLCAGEVHNANSNIQFGVHHLQPHRIWYYQKQAN